MGNTIAEKILARAAGVPAVKAGEGRFVVPDYLFAYDFPGYTDVMFRRLRDEFDIDKVPNPEKFVLFIDHMTPPQTPEEEALHVMTREWCAYQGVNLYEREGIGHQLCAELGYAPPGSFVVHFDGHVSALGAFGCLAIGIGRNWVEPWVTGKTWLEVPGTVKFELTGKLPPGVLGRDLIHKIIGDLGPESCAYRVMEYDGPGVESMSIDGRFSVCGMAMFTGAVTALFRPDEAALQFAREHVRGDFTPVYSDTDAEYVSVHRFDLSAVTPQIVSPPSPRNTVPIEQVEGTIVDQGYIGSCMSGRMEDLRAAAQILTGHRVKRGFRLNVVPSSRAVMAQAAREGVLAALIESGAFISSPSCDYCFGHIQALADGQTAISTGTLNIPGRMGSTKASIYLGSAFSVAAAAIEGRIVDPRKFL